MTIRIADETDHVRIKAARGAVVSSSSILYLPPDIEATGRDIFFAHYVCNFSQTWSVLLKYRNSTTAPEHLTLGLDAVSLAFMVHHTGSAFAKALSWKKYSSALRKINAELQDPDAARRASTFEGAMILDLFEKMSKSVSETTEPHHAHVKGALALVKLRGVESFQKGPELRSLLGLSLNITICCLTMRRKVPDEVRTIRGHASTFVNTTGMRWDLSGAMIDVADLIAEIHAETLTMEEKMIRCAALDSRLEAIAREARPESAYECFVLPREQRSGTLPEDSPPLYHIYPNRTVAQIWNVLRLIRILLYEELFSHFDTPSHSTTHSPPPPFITPTIQQICASVPQTTSCTFAATSKLAHASPPPSGPQAQDTRSPTSSTHTCSSSRSMSQHGRATALPRHAPGCCSSWSTLRRTLASPRRASCAASCCATCRQIVLRSHGM